MTGSRYAVVLITCLACASGCYFPAPAPEAEAELALTVQLPRSLEALLAEEPAEDYFARISLGDASGEIVPIHGLDYHEEELKNFARKKKGTIQLKGLIAGAYVLEMEVGVKGKAHGKWDARYHGRSGEFTVQAGKPTVVEIELKKKAPQQLTPAPPKTWPI
jgi:hypothetical protein